MGYYSDVTIRCRESAYDKFKSLWQNIEGFPEPTNIRRIDDDFYIQWLNVKWNNYYLDFNLSPENYVDNTCDSLDEIDTKTDPASSYCMCIIGEELEDITIRQNDCDYNINLVREVVIPPKFTT